MRKTMAYRVLINKETRECVIPVIEKTLTLRGKSLGAMIVDARNQILEMITDESKIFPDAEDESEISVPAGYIQTYIDVRVETETMKKGYINQTLSEKERVRAINGFDSLDNCIEWIKNEQTVSFTFTQGKMINKIESLAKRYPDDVKILFRNEDGSIYGKMPRKALHLYLVDGKEMSEEQRQASRERLSAFRAKKNQKNK